MSEVEPFNLIMRLTEWGLSLIWEGFHCKGRVRKEDS